MPGLLIALIPFGLGLIIAPGVRAAVRRAVGLRDASPGLASVLGRVAGGVTIKLSFLVAASVAFPSISAADLFNLLAGIVMLLTRALIIEDQIRAGSHGGRVEGVWVRATVLRIHDNQRVLIPNATLFVDEITVITAQDKRGLAFPLTIGNGNDIIAARRVIADALCGTNGVLTDPVPEAIVTGLCAGGVDMTARLWINSPRPRNAVDALDHAISNVKNALTAAGIDLPYPTRQLLFHDQTEDTDGDCSPQSEGWLVGKSPLRGRWQAVRKVDETVHRGTEWA